MEPGTLIATTVAVLVLAAIATIVLAVTRVARPWEIVAALARAALLLALLSLVLAGVI